MIFCRYITNILSVHFLQFYPLSNVLSYATALIRLPETTLWECFNIIDHWLRVDLLEGQTKVTLLAETTFHHTGIYYKHTVKMNLGG